MKRFWLLVAALAACFACYHYGLWRADRGDSPRSRARSAETAPAEPAKDTLWTCPMHPQIQLPDPVPCPICGMDLVPVGDDAEGERRLAMSPEAVALAGVRTAPAELRYVTRPVRMVGKVDFDETAVRTISAWVAGRLERLYVDYTGIPVDVGDHLVLLYSPDLLTAQEELLAARRRVDRPDESSEFLAASNRRAYSSSRDKLLLWGLTPEQVDEIEERGSAEDHITLSSPAAGVVVEKLLNEGAYVQTGTPIYRIADLSRLWVRLEAYEQDLPWLRYGQRVTLQAEALPGEVFEGTVSFIDPVIHEKTRTSKVRINIDNRAGRLKPGMFVRATARARLGAGGRVLDTSMAGKWISPMHPEIVRDEPGTCDVCGMDLVPAEQLGLASSGPVPKAVVVPAGAVLRTGKRAVVYVEVPGERPTFEGREVLLGPRAGAEYIVEGGLREGELVVVEGAFRIDSSMQIRAKPSMLSMPADREAAGLEAHAFLESLQGVIDAYLALQEALAADDLEGARQAARAAHDALGAVDATGLAGAASESWAEEQPLLAEALETAPEAADIGALRERFLTLSRGLLTLDAAAGHLRGTLYEVHCPMAFDGEGGSWLQASREIANPYYGAEMLRCGEVRSERPGTLSSADATETGGSDAHGHGDAHGHEHGDEHAHARGGEHEHEAPRQAGDTVAPTGPAFEALLVGYVALQEALAADDVEGARLEAALISAELAGTPPPSLPAKWVGAIRDALEPVGPGTSIGDLRVAFDALSRAVLPRVDAAPESFAEGLVHAHCPMAFEGRGADWLQRPGELRNPYYGAEMLRCGSVRREVR